MGAGFDRVLFGRKTKGVPAHRVEDIEAPRHFVTPEDVAPGEILGMPGVQSRARWVGKHVENVVFGLRG